MEPRLLLVRQGEGLGLARVLQHDGIAEQGGEELGDPGMTVVDIRLK